MASRTFAQDSVRPDKGVVDMSFRVTTNASGAIVAGSQVGCVGFASVTKTGTGAYVVTLTDPYVDYLNFSVTVNGSSDANKTPLYGQGGTITIGAAAATPTFNFFTLNSAAAATDLSSAAIFSINLVLKNSTV